MAAHTPQASGIEALVVRRRKLFQLLAFVDHGPFLRLEFPLLLVRYRLVDDEAEHQHGGQTVDPGQRAGRIHRHQGREGRHQHKGVLVDRDEEQVEQDPFPARLELLFRAKHGPAVIFLAFPELELIGPFPCEIEGQARSPERGEASHQHEARRHAATGGDDPGIDDGKKAPQLVHLAVVAGNLSHDETIQGAAEHNGAQDLERTELYGVERRPDKDIEQRADDERDD